MWLVQLKGGWDFHLRQSAHSSGSFSLCDLITTQQLVMKACNMYMAHITVSQGFGGPEARLAAAAHAYASLTTSFR
jgi:hypothetical protein